MRNVLYFTHGGAYSGNVSPFQAVDLLNIYWKLLLTLSRQRMKMDMTRKILEAGYEKIADIFYSKRHEFPLAESCRGEIR